MTNAQPGRGRDLVVVGASAGGVEALRAMVAHERPQARIEIATTLGAVVGTHAGPGTVGFFWFEDD